MKKALLLIIGVFMSLSLSYAQSLTVSDYDLLSYGTGVEGTYTAQVTITVKKPGKDTELQLKKAAVHGVIFKGVAKGKTGTAQRPLAEASSESKHADFFNAFFAENGDWKQYSTIIEGSLRMVKTDKKLYRMSAIVSIQKDQLRKHLEDNKIVESFKNMF